MISQALEQPENSDREPRLSRFLSRFLHYAVRERRPDALRLALIAASGHFDARYYRSTYADVVEAGVDPVIHYVDWGAQEQRNPCAQFNTAQYVRRYPQVVERNVNPLLHFLRTRGGASSASSIAAVEAMPSQSPEAPATEVPAEPTGARSRSRAKEPAPRLSSLINHLKSMDDDNLIAALNRIEAAVVVPRARKHFREKAWRRLGELGGTVLGKRPDYQRLLVLCGRAHLYEGNAEGASIALALSTQLFPDSAEAQLYCGIAHVRAKRFDPGIAHLRLALKLDPASVSAKRELGAALRSAARAAQASAESQAMASEASRLLLEVYRAQPAPGPALAAGRTLYEQRRYEECIALLDEVGKDGAPLVEHLLLKSRALVGLNRIAEALAAAEEVLKLEPSNQAAGLLLRTCQFLSGDDEAGTHTFGEVVFGSDGAVQWKGLLPDGAEVNAPSASSIEEVVAQLPYDWVQISMGSRQFVLEPGEEFVRRLALQLDPRAGFHVHGEIRLWRRKALLNLAQSGLLRDPAADLKSYEPMHASVPRPLRPGARAIVMSRNGAYKFGGGEQLLESMAEHYQSLGYDPMIVGTRPEFRGEAGEVNGFPFAFVDEDTSALRRFFLDQDAHLVHAISGLGYRVAEALAYTNIPFIYGVHYWREVLGQEDEGFFDTDGRPVPRPEFNYILSRATTVYANSVFTRNVIEKVFGVRCPLIFSVPKDVGVAA